VATSKTCFQLGRVAQARHDLAGAEKEYRKALEVFLRLGDEHSAALTYHSLGVLAAERRDVGCANNFLQALRRFVACNDSHYAGRALADLRRAYQDGLVTRQGMEEAWQAEMGEPLPPDRAEFLFSPAGQQEGGASPSKTAEYQEMPMAQEVAVLMDPSVGLNPTDLKAAWDADPEARQGGRLQARPARQEYAGFVELVAIPVVVGVTVKVTADLITEAIKRSLAAQGKEAVAVNKQTLPDGQEVVVVQKK
jgi:hypothetical protein